MEGATSTVSGREPGAMRAKQPYYNGGRVARSATNGVLSPDYRLLTPRLLEFLHCGRLALAHAAGFDSGAEVVFAADGRTRHASQHGDLPHVRERVSDRALKQFLGRKS